MFIDLNNLAVLLALVLGLVIVFLLLGWAISRHMRQKTLRHRGQLVKNQKIDGMIQSYVKTQKNPEKHMKLLQYQLHAEGFELDDKIIAEMITTHKKLLEFKKREPFVTAQLFTGTRQPRKYRNYASPFCPNPTCQQFKNYEKECPHCGFHEQASIGRGSYFCPNCSHPKAYNSSCPVCGFKEMSS